VVVVVANLRLDTRRGTQADVPRGSGVYKLCNM